MVNTPNGWFQLVGGEVPIDDYARVSSCKPADSCATKLMSTLPVSKDHQHRQQRPVCYNLRVILCFNHFSNTKESLLTWTHDTGSRIWQLANVWIWQNPTQLMGRTFSAMIATLVSERTKTGVLLNPKKHLRISYRLLYTPSQSKCGFRFRLI